MQVSLIRHGKAEYRNTEPTSDRENACDIIPSTLSELKVQAEDFVSKMREEDIVTIWSSPIPRALETSRIFEEALVSAGKNIRKTAIFDAFEEARGFKFAYLHALVNGGSIHLEGETLQIDSLLTNPEKLTLGEYFRQSYWKQLSPEIIQTLGVFGPVAQSIEPYDEIVNRVTGALGRLSHLPDKKHHLLIFTHQCCTDFVIEEVNNYEKGGINPGQSVTLQINEMGINIIDTPFGKGDADKILAGIKNKTTGLLSE